MYLYIRFNRIHKTASSGSRWKIAPEKNPSSFTDYEFGSRTLTHSLLWSVSKRNHMHPGSNSAADWQQLHSTPLVSALPAVPETFPWWTSSKRTVKNLVLTFSSFLASISSSPIVTRATLFIFHWKKSGSWLWTGLIFLVTGAHSQSVSLPVIPSLLLIVAEIELMLPPKWFI